MAMFSVMEMDIYLQDSLVCIQFQIRTEKIISHKRRINWPIDDMMPGRWTKDRSELATQFINSDDVQWVNFMV